jgi:hypothetical protein
VAEGFGTGHARKAKRFHRAALENQFAGFEPPLSRELLDLNRIETIERDALLFDVSKRILDNDAAICEPITTTMGIAPTGDHEWDSWYDFIEVQE